MLKSTLFEYAGRRAVCDTKDTIVISGSPRSGTTWLLEILRTLPGRKAMNEPLMYEEARHEHGFDWRTYMKPTEDAPTQRAYIEKILSGQLGISPAWYFEASSRLTQLVEHGSRDTLVVKFCRLNRMLHWFCHTFDVRGPIFIVRHPCAVVASMLKHGAWKEQSLHGSERESHALHNETLPEDLEAKFRPILKSAETQVEALAVMWCLDHYVPLVHHSDEGFPWVLVPYERLVTHGEKELARITKAIDIELTTEMIEQLGQPSASIRDRPKEQAEKQLSKWKHRLTVAQADSVLEIVDAAGLSHVYNHSTEPAYDWLNVRQRTRARW